MSDAVMRTVFETPLYRRPGGKAPYSQGIRIPRNYDLLYTAGLVARDDNGAIVAPDDVEGQTRQIFNVMAHLLAKGGARLADVVKLTVYVRDIGELPKVYQVRQELWPSAPPVSTTVEVSRFVSDEIRIEIDAVAAVPSKGAA